MTKKVIIEKPTVAAKSSTTTTKSKVVSKVPTTTTKKSTKSTTPAVIEKKKAEIKVDTKNINKIQIVNLEDILKSTETQNNKQEKNKSKKTLNSQQILNEKGEQLVQKVLSFFKIAGIKDVKLNEFEKLENEIKNNNSNKILKKVSNNYILIFELINKFLERDEITALAVLLVITRTVSSFNAPELIPTLIKQNRFDMIQIIAKYYCEINTNDIVSLISFVINNQSFKSISEELEQPSTNNNITNQTSKSSPELDSLLSIPLNHNSMVTQIRTLPIDNVVTLLKYLYSRISLFQLNDQQEQEGESNNNNKYLTLNQIIDWISLIFDSHFQELILKIENINQYFGPIRSLYNNSKSFFYTKSFIDFLEKSQSTKSIENNDYSIYHYKF